MKNKKLLLAAPSFYPFYGGAEIRFRRYLPLLKERGIDSCVFTGTPKAKKITDEHKTEAWYSVNEGDELPTESYQNIEVTRYRLPEKPAKKRLGMYHHKLREKIVTKYRDVNVIQFLSPFPISALDTFNIARQNNISTVLACTLAKTPHSNLIKRLVHSYKVRKLYSSCDCVVVSSEEMKQYLLGYGVNNRIEVIGNGVDTNIFYPVNCDEEKKQIRKKLGIPFDKKILLNVGTVNPRKGTDLLLGAFSIIAKHREDVELFIAGSRVDQIDENLRDFRCLISDYESNAELRDKIHFLGLIDNVDEYMKAADIFVFPSREEGMGNVVMEAMASRLPVITTNYLGFPKVFGEDGKHYMHADFDKNSIANQLLKSIDSKNLLDELSKNSLLNVNLNLGIQNSINQYENLYSDLSKLS